MFQPPCLCTQQVAASDWVLLASSSAASTVASGMASVPVNKAICSPALGKESVGWQGLIIP